MAEFRMPSLGADMEYGSLLEWRVKPGDAVKRGDIVAVVDTSKAEIEVEVFEDGVVEELLVAEGTTHVPVGTVLARIGDGTGLAPVAGGASESGEGAAGASQAESSAPSAEPASAPPVEPTSASPAEPTPAPPAEPAPAPTSQPPPGAPPPAPPHHLRASPLARRVAEQRGVDLAAVHGSGPGGAITRADVERAAAPGRPAAAQTSPSRAPSQAPAPVQQPTAAAAERQAEMRRAIGALMARSKREVPHYYLEHAIDLARALDWLQEENLARPLERRLLPSALLLAAAARATARTPAMNGFWIDGGFRQAQGVHLGVAISLRGGGLVAPAIHDADRLTLDELMAALRDLVLRARAGRLRASEMSDPTITVTNLGERGVEVVHGVLYAPQVALIGFGGIRERPWAVDGMLTVRPIVHATLAADHRAGDGHAGSRFLALIDDLLQRPEEL